MRQRTATTAKPPGLSEQLREANEAYDLMKLKYRTLFGAVLEVMKQNSYNCERGCPVAAVDPVFCADRREGELCAVTLRAWVETEVGI